MENGRTLNIRRLRWAGWAGSHSTQYLAAAQHFRSSRFRRHGYTRPRPGRKWTSVCVDVLGYQRTVDDYRDLLADPQIEAVSICSPNFLHH